MFLNVAFSTSFCRHEKRQGLADDFGITMFEIILVYTRRAEKFNSGAGATHADTLDSKTNASEPLPKISRAVYNRRWRETVYGEKYSRYLVLRFQVMSK